MSEVSEFFLRFLGNGKEFSSAIICIMLRKFIFYSRVSTYMPIFIISLLNALLLLI